MSRKKLLRKTKVDANSLTCRPLDSYSEILLFLENPPPWRSLCQGMTPHSNTVIRNREINKHYAFHTLETPEHFCHYDPDVEEPQRYDPKHLCKTLVCHDMANGYHDDSIIDGTGNVDSYTFYNWAGVDIFCYFSHHLITIPPLGWINVGHAHGVKVIGTIITEWAEGITFWDQVLVSETEYQNLANALVAIAKTLKFDGYLLNVENKVSKPNMLLEFVQYFHNLLHEELEHAVLVWYDSVTVQGTLNWQNKLNDKNKPFFDACDGFFTNYSWTVNDVVSSAELAEDRVTDVYIGIDVWGRNFFGGGQFNTQEAIKVAHSAGCSVALFAPGWTYEALSSDKNDTNNVAMAEDLSSYSRFLLRDRAFWNSIWPFLNTHVPCQLPFRTSFCRGQGIKRRLYGEVLSPSPWFNLRHQQYQPNSAHGPHGYMLSTAETIIKVSRTAQFKDKKGIIRYRSSFQMSRNELHHAAKGSTLRVHSNDSVRESDDDPTETAYKSEDDITKSDSQKAVRKTTMTDALKNLFKQKTSKSSVEAIGNRKSVAEDEGRIEAERQLSMSQELESAGPSGRSMLQMSVNLHLGSADKMRYCLAHVAEEQECLQQYWEDSFIGGTCLKVNPSDQLCPEHRFTRLLWCDFECEESLIFCVVTKPLPEHADQTLNVTLGMQNAGGAALSVELTGRDVRLGAALGAGAAGRHILYPLDTRQAPVLQDLRTYLLLNYPDFYVPIDNCFGWLVRYYEMNVPGSRILNINMRTGLPQGGILLGHFGICRKIHQKE